MPLGNEKKKNNNDPFVVYIVSRSRQTADTLVPATGAIEYIISARTIGVYPVHIGMDTALNASGRYLILY